MKCQLITRLMTRVKIVSLNVRGISQLAKRKSTFAFIRSKKPQIVFLQETHSKKKEIRIWRSMWGANIVASHGTTASAGVAIMFNRNLNYKLLKVSTDPNGRFVIIDVEINQKILTLVNVYAPNKDSPEFFTDIFKFQQEHENSEIVMGGDFNMIMNPTIDCSNPDRKNNNNSKQILLEYCEQMMLVDIFRLVNPESRKYSWSKTRPSYTGSRIDFFMINYGITANAKADIQVAPLTDHDMITLEIEMEPVKRGNGYWKFNNSLLKNRTFLSEINCKLDESLSNIFNHKPDEFWEILKDRLIEHSKKQSIQIAKENSKCMEIIIEKLEKLKEKLESRSKSVNIEDDCEALIQSKCLYENKINNMLKNKTQGQIIRSKYKWYTEGEQPSNKYFLNLEKVRYSNKTIKKLILEDKTIIRDQGKIIAEQHKFYKRLYTSNPNVFFAYTNDTDVRLTNTQRDDLDKPIQLTELSKAVSEMANDSAPGIDGLTAGFYKVFWTKLREPLYRALRYCIDITGRLLYSSRTGVLSLIPKAGKRPDLLVSWRPITLMCVDHKILAKTLANRVKPVLATIISESQTGYMKGRFIGMNIRRLMDLYQYVNNQQMNAMIISVDFFKAFDSIELKAVQGALKYFNFGEKFIQMILVLYADFQTKIIHNGHFSDYIQPSRGLHQGCAISGYLFIITTEILAINLKVNENIKSIPIPNSKDGELLSQFVDDLTISILYDQTSLDAVINELQEFHQNTGLSVNYDKTTIYRVGRLKNTNKKLLSSRNFKWADSDINMLGVVIDDCDLNSTFSKILTKMNAITKLWRQRGLTIKGKVSIANSLLGSLLVYPMQVMPMITKNINQKITKILQEFIWNGRKPKLKMNVMCANVKDGGLGLFDPMLKDKALKIAWVPRIINMCPVSKSLSYSVINPVVKNDEFWMLNIHPKDVPQICKADPFWRSVITSYAEVNYHEITNFDVLMHERIMYNSHIKVANRLFNLPQLTEIGISEFQDIVDSQNAKLYDHQKIQEVYDIKLGYLDYASLISAIPKKWKAMLSDSKLNIDLELENEPLLYKLNCTPKPAGYVYQLMLKTNEIVEKQQLKWQETMEMEISIDDIHKGNNSARLTKIAKYSSFQFRLMHRIIFLNDRLYHCKLSDTQSCQFCNCHKENYKHLFVECQFIKKIWTDLIKWVKLQDLIDPEINYKNVIFNTIVQDPFHFANLVCLIFKTMIYIAKCKKESITYQQVICELKFIKELDKRLCTNKKSKDKFRKKWKESLA